MVLAVGHAEGEVRGVEGEVVGLEGGGGEDVGSECISMKLLCSKVRMGHSKRCRSGGKVHFRIQMDLDCDHSTRVTWASFIGIPGQYK